MDRYHRQTLLPQIGPAGQARLGRSRALLIGCGALGTVIAEQLTRAGVGMLGIVDRDIVELTNLQRQVLFDEADAREAAPKAIAAARRLVAINSSIEIEPIVADVFAGNIEELTGLESGKRFDLLIDGTDNVETRYLINDVSVKHSVPWIYGACVGMEGRMMAIRPPATACLRCLFQTPPGAGELPTCDAVGVFSPVASVIASLQSAAAIKILAGAEDSFQSELLTVNLWTSRFHRLDASEAKRSDCTTCGKRQFEFLNHCGGGSTSLCGRNAVQVRPSHVGTKLDLTEFARRLAPAGVVEQTPWLLRCRLMDPPNVSLTLFPDGRLIVHGVSEPQRARSIYARYIGS